MPLVNVMVNARAYTIACDEGEEAVALFVQFGDFGARIGERGTRSGKRRGLRVELGQRRVEALHSDVQPAHARLLSCDSARP